jgi:dienelactone hydrolase
VHLEIPFGEEKVVLDGHHQGGTISGNYDYSGARGTFGLTSVAEVTIESLERYYGAYQVSPGRVISILRGWNDPRTLNYVDYKTGQVGTLWPASESEFFSGAGRAVSFPVTLRASFEEDASGRVMSWRPVSGSHLKARAIAVKEERFAFKNGDITLGGTLILPAAAGRHPVVIVTPGDFGTNRNQLRLWAHDYVSRGVAAFVFDSRGAGESAGTVGSNSFSDLANDVLAAVQRFESHDAIDPNRIGAFGFSNSAWTVSLAASRSKSVAFLILQSFSGVTPWRQEIFRAETQLRVDGYPESVVKQGGEFMRLKFEVARTGNGWEQAQEIMEQARGERWLAYTNPPRTLERLKQVYAASMTYDPVPALEGLDVPILAYWGGKDTYVPAPESISIFKQAMAAAGNKDCVIKVYPNGSHSLIETESGSPSTGATSKKYVAGLWEMQGDWLLEHARVPE